MTPPRLQPPAVPAVPVAARAMAPPPMPLGPLGPLPFAPFTPFAPLAPLAPPLAVAGPTAGLPGPELQAVPPRHRALPNPVPGLVDLLRIALAAPAGHRWVVGAHPAQLRNAHYTNTRAQLAYALAGPYNSVEGDVRVVDGVAVMRHDSGAPFDLTFAQWALLAHRAGKHLRIDVKDAAAFAEVSETLQQLGIPSGSITFNVGVYSPWSNSNLGISEIQALRSRFPHAWITLNLPFPSIPGFLVVAKAARAVGSERLGVAVMDGMVSAGDVAALRRDFAAVNAWNLPQLTSPSDLAAATARLRHMGVNGMVDLRSADDPLAHP